MRVAVAVALREGGMLVLVAVPIAVGVRVSVREGVAVAIGAAERVGVDGGLIVGVDVPVEVGAGEALITRESSLERGPVTPDASYAATAK